MTKAHDAWYKSWKSLVTLIVVVVVAAVGVLYFSGHFDERRPDSRGVDLCPIPDGSSSLDLDTLSAREQTAVKAAAKNAKYIVNRCRDLTNINPYWIASGPRARSVADIDPLRSVAFLEQAGSVGVMWWLGSASKSYVCPKSPEYYDCAKPDWGLDEPAECAGADDEERCQAEEEALVWRTNVGLTARTVAKLSEPDAEFRLPESWFDGLDEYGRKRLSFEYRGVTGVPDEFRGRSDYGWVAFAPLLRYADFPDDVLVRLSVEILRADADIDWGARQPDARNPYDPESPDALDPVAPVLVALERNDNAAKRVAAKTDDERVTKLLAG